MPDALERRGMQKCKYMLQRRENQGEEFRVEKEERQAEQTMRLWEIKEKTQDELVLSVSGSSNNV